MPCSNATASRNPNLRQASGGRAKAARRRPFISVASRYTKDVSAHTAKAALFRDARYPATPMPAKPSSIIAQVDVSGTSVEIVASGPVPKLQ